MKSNHAQVFRWVRKWQKRLNLGEWEINITFEDLKRPEDTQYYSADGRSDVQTSYMSAHLTFGKNKQITEDVVVHEMVHLLTSELFGFAVAQEGSGKTDTWSDYFNERLVVRITRILVPES